MSLARTFAVLVLLGIVGLAGYQIGIGQTIGTPLPAAAAPVAYYGYPYGFGFGFLGFLFPLFFLFLIFGLLRAAMFGGRGWGHRGSGYGSGKWQGGPWMGDEARSRIEQLHKELHGSTEKPASGGPSSTST